MIRDHRPAIHVLNQDMEKKLLIHANKWHWRRYSYRARFDQLVLEVEELRQALESESPEAAELECADIANLSMMINDNLHHEENRSI